MSLAQVALALCVFVLLFTTAPLPALAALLSSQQVETTQQSGKSRLPSVCTAWMIRDASSLTWRWPTGYVRRINQDVANPMAPYPDYLRIGTHPAAACAHQSMIEGWHPGVYLDRYVLLPLNEIVRYDARVPTAAQRLGRQAIFATSDSGAMFGWDEERSTMTYLSRECSSDADIVDIGTGLQDWPSVILRPEYVLSGTLRPYYIPRGALPLSRTVRALCAPDVLVAAHDQVRKALREQGFVPLRHDHHQHHAISAYGTECGVFVLLQTLPEDLAGYSAFDTRMRIRCLEELHFESAIQACEDCGLVVDHTPIC
jgi:hypothetical protein